MSILTVTILGTSRVRYLSNRESTRLSTGESLQRILQILWSLLFNRMSKPTGIGFDRFSKGPSLRL
jgi:hypothetical protein